MVQLGTFCFLFSVCQGSALKHLIPFCNARHIEAPFLGHGVSAQACAARLITRFIRDASFTKLDTDCLETLPASTFFEPMQPAAPEATR